MPPLRGDDRRGAADQAPLPAKGSSRAGLTVTVRNSPPKSDEGYGAVFGPCDVHHGGPGTPPLAVPT